MIHLEKEVCNFPDLALVLEREKENALVSTNRPKTVNKVPPVSRSCFPELGSRHPGNRGWWGRETRRTPSALGLGSLERSRTMGLAGGETDITVFPTLRPNLFSCSHETTHHLPHH